jgi:hypothetical protein
MRDNNDGDDDDDGDGSECGAAQPLLPRPTSFVDAIPSAARSPPPPSPPP